MATRFWVALLVASPFLLSGLADVQARRAIRTHRSTGRVTPASLHLDPVLADLLAPHPEWVTKLVTSHDPYGGNRDNSFEWAPVDGDYFVLFHARGEGRITRLFMTADPVHDIPKDYKELWIEADDRTIFRGPPQDFFEGNGPFQQPLVL